MKKIITTVAMFTFVLFAFGQKMDVGSGAYVTLNQGGYITIDGYLVTNGTFTVKSNSSGTGSLIIDGTGTTTGNVKFERYMTEGEWHYISEPVNDIRVFNAVNFLYLTSGSGNDDFYRWDENYSNSGITGWWINILNSSEYSSGTFQTAQGYLISHTGTGSQTIDFLGVPNTGDQSITMSVSSGTYVGSNLVGNPFTSTIAANSGAQATNNFIDKNTSVFASGYAAVYLWDDGISDYVTINNLSSATYIEPGQGFMVVAASNGSTLNFHEVIQKHGTASFYKAGKDDVPRFEIMVTGPENELNKTLIAFIPEMTNGLDESYDARKFSGNPNLALYTKLVDDDGADYAIQTLPPIVDGVSVKVGIRAEITGAYLFEPTLIENFSDDVPINLEDKTTGIIQDLRKHPVYSFEVFETGIFDDRFVLHFKDAVGIEENLQTQSVQFYVSNNVLYIIDEEIGNGTVSLFNMLGQRVMTKEITGNTSEINLDLPSGYYIVNICTDKSPVNGKVFIK